MVVFALETIYFSPRRHTWEKLQKMKVQLVPTGAHKLFLALL